jgi:hypothetical protein
MEKREHTNRTLRVIGIVVCVVCVTVGVVVGIEVVPKLLAPSDAERHKAAREAINTWAKMNGRGLEGKAESVRLIWSGIPSGQSIVVYRARILGGDFPFGPPEMDFRIRLEGRKAIIEDSWLTADELNLMQDRHYFYR